jgi:signal transduction histidine kinase
VLRRIRFGENDYFFGYDYKGVNVFHGPKPEMEGKNFYPVLCVRAPCLIPTLVGRAASSARNSQRAIGIEYAADALGVDGMDF